MSFVFFLVASMLAAQGTPTLPVERLDGFKMQISNWVEHNVTVVAVLSTRCPFSAVAAETLRRLNNQFRRKNIMFTAVFPNPAESAIEVRSFCQANGFVFPCYRDPGHAAVRQLKAKVTPQVFVLNRLGSALYKGSVQGLESMLVLIAENKPVSLKSTEAEGTPIDKPAPPRKWDDPYRTISFSSELIFEKIPSAPAHHASSIVEAGNGDLLVTWYGGSYESSDDEALYVSRRARGSRTWTAPVKLIPAGERMVGNGIIFRDARNRLYIVWARMDSTQPLLAHTGWFTTKLFYRTSDDHGISWSRDKEFPMDTTGWLPRNLPIVLKSGEILLPLSDERNNKDLSFFAISKDNGATWKRSENIPNTAAQGEQPTVALRPDGSLMTLLRTGPRLLQSESVDSGVTWSPAHPTEFKNPDAAIALCTLKNGNILLVWNNVERGRTPLHVARSTDGGKTFSEPLQLESTPGEYSYPSVLQSSDGKIHITYTYRRFSIKHVEFNEEWLHTFGRPD